MVELDERPVAELPGRQVVVLDVLGHERPGERSGRLVRVRRQPVTVRLLLGAGVDRGKRGRNPARLERVRRVSPRTDGQEAELGASLDDQVADLVVVGVGAPDLQAGGAGHAVTQSTHVHAADLHLRHVEEAELLERSAVEFFDHGPGVRALDLEAVVLARDGVTVRARVRAAVDLDVQVLVAAGLAMEHEPVRCGRAADIDVFVFGFAEQDAVADDVSRSRRGNVLLGLVDREVRDGVDGGVGDQLDGIRPLEEHVVHVVGLVVEHGGVAPRLLFLDPVGEVGWHDGVDVRADLGVAQQLDGRARRVDDLLQILRCHDEPFFGVVMVRVRRRRCGCRVGSRGLVRATARRARGLPVRRRRRGVAGRRRSRRG